ncbi:hypothetical protein C9374_006521 [Naegleria lovaniensis]|uniref:F-box domain-containing protein n=1 Tax=Naegleria lovaniensis TaxID=51637 RepID=A0AA88GNM6_NAELO|nr:uncharacterized protein C9374_006521 [Naegleria lovaniensis]KAG2381532.1 hypothetical protein C9374_006521 [Naegleria lovaniensis]
MKRPSDQVSLTSTTNNHDLNTCTKKVKRTPPTVHEQDPSVIVSIDSDQQLQTHHHDGMVSLLKLDDDSLAHVFSFLHPLHDLLGSIMRTCRRCYELTGGIALDALDNKVLIPNDQQSSHHDDGKNSILVHNEKEQKNEKQDGRNFHSLYEKVSLGFKPTGCPTRYYATKKNIQFSSDFMLRLFKIIHKCNPVNGCKYLDLGREGDCNDLVKMNFSMEMFQFALQTGIFTGLKRLRFGCSFHTFVKNLKQDEMQVLLAWFSTLKNLEHLEVPSLDSWEDYSNEMPPQSLTYMLYKTLLTNCTKLKSLKCGLCCTQPFGDHLVFDSLEELDLLYYFPEENFDYLFKTIPNLKKLTMGYHMCYSNELFQSIATNCKKLLDFKFGERYLHESGNVPIIFNSMTQLESLHFDGGMPYEEDLREIAAKCTNLVYFSTSEEYEGDDYSIQDFLNDMKLRLRNFDLNYLFNTDEEGDDQEENEEDGDQENDETGDDKVNNESKRAEKTLHSINKKYPCIEVLNGHSESLPANMTIQQLFQHLPNLKIVNINIMAEGCDKTFEDVEQDVKTRLEATNTLLKLIHGENRELCDHLIDDRFTFTTIRIDEGATVRLKIKIVEVNYDGFVSFKVMKLE